MDNRLIFLYQCMNDGVTEKVIAGRLLDLRFKCQVLQVGKSACCKGEARVRVNPSGSSEAAYIMLPRKTSSLSCIDRTENEHTWSRRVS